MKCKKCYQVGKPYYKTVGDHVGRYCIFCHAYGGWVKKTTVLKYKLRIEEDKLNKELF